MTIFHRITFAILVLAAAGCKDMGTEPQIALPPNPPPGATVSFAQNVLPIFTRFGCISCHGGTNGLTVGTVAQLLAGGQSGAAIVAGQAENSLLIRKLSAPPPFGSRMPQGGPYLPDSTITVLKSWINQGALNN
jgi:hypothetical protein